MKKLKLWPEFKHNTIESPRILGSLLAVDECERADFDITLYNADHIKDEFAAYLTNGDIAELSPREWNEFVDGFHASLRRRKKPTYSIMPEDEIMQERGWTEGTLGGILRNFIMSEGLEHKLAEYIRQRAEEEWEAAFPD